MTSATIFERVFSVASEAFLSLGKDGSPRVRSWPLMNLNDALLIVSSYLGLVFVLRALIGIRGKGFELRPVVLVHNLAMTLLSAYMFMECLSQVTFLRFSLFGNAVDHTSEKGKGLASVLWLFYVSKVLEFVDTIIMALRHRFRQISFLHVYHHSSIFLIWWGVVFYCPGGEAYFSCALNSFVHIWMYAYYFWSALYGKSDPMKKATWREPAFYRRYITRMQIGQFMLMLIQASYDLVSPTSQFSRPCAAVLFVYMLSMLYLFGSFYSKQYTHKKHPALKEA